MKKEIVTGLVNFDEIVSGEALYVDKTNFARDVFHSGSAAMLILRPRRWGKSLNLAMLKYFLEAPLKKGAQTPGEIDLEKLEAKKDFFRDKKVLLEDPEMAKHLGQYSVISISLGGIQTETKDSFFGSFGEAIRTCFEKHESLLSWISEGEKKIFKSFLNKEAPQTDFSGCLHFLSSLLKKIYHRPIWLLLDEYDAAVNSVWEKALKKKSGADELLEELVGFFGSFYESSVKGNEHVYRTLFTGVFRVLKGSMGTSMNNFQEYSLLDAFFDRDFGFTKKEILTTLDELQIPKENHPEKLKEASDWYNGYQSTGGPIYNPWSIMYWLKRGKAEAYWVNMGSLDIILGISQYNQYTEELSQLVLGKTVQGKLLWGLVLRQCTPGSARFKNAFWTLLAFSGYIGIERRVDQLGDQVVCEFKLPNRELSEYFKYCLTDDFQNRYNVDDSDFQIFIKDLLEGRVDRFEEKLKDFLRKIVNPLDVAENKIEAFYQGFFLGLISHCEKNYFIRSEFPAGEGRADLLLIPKSHFSKKRAVLLEYKVSRKQKGLEALSKEALDQVLKKDYHAEVENHDYVTSSTSVGLSFYGKDCAIFSKDWKR